VARYCFCGCGRQVRFSDKRFSKEGADTARILEALEGIPAPTVPEDDAVSSTLEALISEGRVYWIYWRNAVHDGVGTTLGDPAQTYRAFRDWKREARQLARSHGRALDGRGEPADVRVTNESSWPLHEF
jgi:hypothetical protein